MTEVDGICWGDAMDDGKQHGGWFIGRTFRQDSWARPLEEGLEAASKIASCSTLLGPVNPKQGDHGGSPLHVASRLDV